MDEEVDDFDKVPLVNLHDAKHPIGPIFENYFQTSLVHGVPDADDPFYSVKDSNKKAALLEYALFHIIMAPTDTKLYTRSAKFIPGSTFSGKVGPRPSCRVVVVGKIPDDKSVPLNRDSVELGIVSPLDQNLGYTKDFLIQAFKDAGFPEAEWREFYMTNLCRFPRIDAGLKKNVPAAWFKEGLAFLEQELKIIKPDFILAMGTDCSKKLAGLPITKALGNVFDYEIDDHIAKVVCVNDPKRIVEEPEERPLFLSGLGVLRSHLMGEKQEERNRENYHYIEDEKTLEALVNKLIDEGHTDFSIDCEWGGKHHLDADSGLRTVQLAWSEKDCMVVILRRQFMKKAFRPYISSAFVHLRRLLQRPTVRIIGHSLSADFPWLKEMGLDLSGQVYFDTILASHLFEPTMSHGLEDLAVKHIPGWIRQDFALTEWIDANTKLADVKSKGYANIPDDLLHPYGGDDVISTLLLYRKYDAAFKQPENKGLLDLFKSYVMPATLPLIDIEMTGVLMDRPRILSMMEAYVDTASQLTADFREMIDNPSFNPASDKQKQKLLFDTLGLEPVKTTDNPPLLWEEVLENDLIDKVAPSVDSETLEILSAESHVAAELHKITLLGTVIKNQLVPPKVDSKGNKAYTKGFAGFIKPDGRIHTRISQMLKTGRLASLDPNIMNIANKQESAVQRIFKDRNIDVPKLRSAFTVPNGKMLVVADYKQAEIAALAFASGDSNLIAAVKRGDDIHSVVCKQMFKLDCTLDEIKKKYKHLRVAAKSIVFGYEVIYPEPNTIHICKGVHQGV